MKKEELRAVVYDTLESAARIIRESDMNPSIQCVLVVGTLDVCRQIMQETAHPDFSPAAYMDWLARAEGRVYLGTDFVAGQRVSVTIMATSKAEAARVLFARDVLPTMTPTTRFSKDFRITVNPRVIEAAAKCPGTPLYASSVDALDFMPFTDRRSLIKQSHSAFTPVSNSMPTDQNAAGRFRSLPSR